MTACDCGAPAYVNYRHEQDSAPYAVTVQGTSRISVAERIRLAGISVSTWCRDGTQSSCATTKRETGFRSLGDHPAQVTGGGRGSEHKHASAPWAGGAEATGGSAGPTWAVTVQHLWDPARDSRRAWMRQ